jgi:hypothetical protein
MKILACVTIVIFILSGCTTVKPMQLSRSEYSGCIILGDSIHSGDKVKITTRDGKKYELRVASVDDEYIKGKDIEIPIKDISQIDKRMFSIGKTLTLVGAIILAGMMLVHSIENNVAFMQ